MSSIQKKKSLKTKLKLLKRLSTKSSTDVSMRESFSQRIDDDLSEVILQFLPQKDKFRFECVSKQFQRTVFVKHYELNCFADKSLADNQKLKSFESMIKKCPNIRSIGISFDYFIRNISSEDVKNQVIQSIIDNCHHLRDVDFNFEGIDSKTKQMFIEKIGTQLKKIEVLSKTIGKSFPNLEVIKSLTLSAVSGLQFNKLRKLSIDYWEDINDLKQFIESHKSVTHLKIGDIDIETQDFEAILKSLCQLKNLVHLDFDDFSINLKNDSIVRALVQLSDECPNVKSIACRLKFNYYYGTDFLAVFQNFRQLKRFDLYLEYQEWDIDDEEYDEDQDYEQNWDLYSMKIFEGFSQLTHLTIFYEKDYKYDRFNEEYNLDVDNVVQIEDYLPNLRYLEIRNELRDNNTFRYVLRCLSRLEVLKLNPKKEIYPKLVSDWVKNCKKFKYVVNVNEW